MKFAGFVYRSHNGEICDFQGLRILQSGQSCALGTFSKLPPASTAGSKLVRVRPPDPGRSGGHLDAPLASRIGVAAVITEEMARFEPVGSTNNSPPRDPWLLVGEITHRVVNEYALVISSLSLVAAGSANREAKATILEATRRLRDFANAHRALQEPVLSGPTDLAEYLRGICSAMVRANLNERGVRLTLIEQQVELEPKRCWHVGLIVSELIVNAMRHGFGGGSGSIVVEIRAANGEIQCQVADDGHFSADPRLGRGSIIIEALARELGGYIKRQFGVEGTNVLSVVSARSGNAAPSDRRAR